MEKTGCQDLGGERKSAHVPPQSAQYHRMLFEDSPIGLLVCRMDGRIVDANKTMGKIVGRSIDELLGLTYQELTPKSCEHIDRKILKTLSRHGHYGPCEKQYFHSDGHLVPVRLSGIIIEQDGEELVCSSVEDFSDRKLTEHALQDQLKLHESLLASIPYPVFYKDLEGRFQGCNEAFIKFVGRPAKNIIGKSLDNMWGEYSHVLQSMSQELRKDGGTQSYEGPLPNGRGQLREVMLHKSVFTHGDGQVAGMVGAFVDITDRKRIEESLRESEEQLRTFINNADEILYSMSTSGMLLSISPNLKDKLGYAPVNVIGHPFVEFIHEEDQPLFRQSLATIQTGQSDKIEARIRLADGQYRWHILSNSSVKDDDAQPIYCIGIAHDIQARKKAESERLKLEAKFQQAQKLESLGILAGGIAHDFNNLLVGILGNADLALSELPADSSSRELIDHVKESALRASELTGQMLAYSGKGRFVVHKIDLSKLIGDMNQLINASISKKANLNLELAENLPPIEADDAQMRQVIVNLITNASEALASQSGTIAVRTSVVQATTEQLAQPYLDDELQAGQYVCLEVCDDGCGMDSETLGRLFDPFYSTKFTGRGLGLAAVLGIVRGHRGSINVTSQPNVGTTVQVLLPVSEQPSPKPAKAKTNLANWQGQGTILVVDDEEMVAIVAKKMLTRHGFSVLTACDGQAAVDTFTQHADEIKAVLLDMTMPVMGGVQACEKLCQIRPDIPVLLCSGYSEEEAASQFAAENLAGFVQKPFEFDSLLEKLKQVIQ